MSGLLSMHWHFKSKHTVKRQGLLSYIESVCVWGAAENTFSQQLFNILKKVGRLNQPQPFSLLGPEKYQNRV